MPHPDNESISLLNVLYKSTRAQSDIINAMISKAEDDTMKTDLSQRLHTFRALETDICREIRSRNEYVFENTSLSDAVSLAGAKLRVGTSKDSEKIAKVIKEYTDKNRRKVSQSSSLTNSCDAKVHTLAGELDNAQKTLYSCLNDYL